MPFGTQFSSLQCASRQQVAINWYVLISFIFVLTGNLLLPQAASAQVNASDQDIQPIRFKPSPTRDKSVAESGLNPGKVQGGPFSVQTGGSNPLNGEDVGSESAPFLVDIDNDGDLDLFAGATDGTIYYYENTGSASSATYVQRTGGSNPANGIDVGSWCTPALVDIDDDDDFDLFISDESSNIFYYRNTGTVSSPTFSSTTSPLTGPVATDENKPGFVDIDNDGDYDVFLGASNGGLVYFENTGSASSATFVQRTGGSNPFNGVDVGSYSSVNFVDIDHDGDWDAFAGEEAGVINFFENTGSTASPTFVQRTGNANYLDGVDVGNYSRPILMDLDNDGDWDLFIGEEDGNFNYYLNNEDPVTTAPGGLFNNIVLWLKADAGVTGTSNVTAWADQTNQSNDAAQATSSRQPSKTDGAINYQPALTFDGTDDFLDVPYSDGLHHGKVQIFSVHKSTDAPSFASPFTSRDGSTTEGYLLYEDDSDLYAFWTAASSSWNAITGGSVTFNSFELVSVSGQTGAGDAEKYLYVDGAQTGSSTTATFDTATGSGSPYRVGAGATESASGNYFWEGDIAEQIVFNVVLSQTERYQVDTYLALKYGIHISHNYLASDETSLWDATANSTYHNDVAGIGRDDASGLNQKQSTSQGGGIVEIGLGAIATDNASNANSFSGDLAFMVWGHDNATTSLATAFSGSSINMRMARIWKVEETSTVGTVEIQIPDSYSATHLIVSSSSSLTSPTETALTDNGDGTMSTTVNFSDGDYFSFGSSSVGPGGVAANLNMWFKADAGVFSDNGCTTALTGSDTNDALGCWVDQSNNGFVTSQSSSSLRADHSIGGLNYNPVFTFDESDDDRLDFATTPITAPSDIHAYYILDENDSDGDNHLLASETGGRFYIRTMTASFGDNASVTETVPSGTYMANAHYDLGTTTMTFSVDAGTPITESQNWSSAPTGNFKLGAHGSGSGDSFNQYNGTLAEMIVYTADHANGNDEQKIQSYLGLKYGLSLPITYIASDATTLWDATSNASYHNDVAGIGRDDDSELNQKQSASQSSGIVAIGLGALASDNASNANSFSGDVTYMVWGHDNASTDVATAYSGTSTNVRMARIWKVEETNTVGNVEIQIPDTYGATHLIVSSSSALTTPTETLLTDNGDGTMSTTVNFSDGEFFTFGTSTTGPGGVSTSLILWLDADTGVTESSNDVSSWADQSVNGNDATQGTTSFQPDYQSNALNYNPGIAFDGSDDVLDTGMDISAGTISDLTLLAVYKPDVDNAGGVWGEDDTNWDRFIWDNASYDNVVSTGSAGLTITGLFVAEQAVFSTVVFDEDAASGSAVYVDGTLGQQFTANHDPQTSASLQIGSVGSSNHEFDGTIYEVIAYSALLSTTAREQVESYLALKYGITLGHNYLASDGSTIWDYTAQTAYHNDVAGIGRDDEAVLDQRQSVSESGSIVSIGLGAVAADNASNANAFSADLSFLMWGHDNGSTNLATDFSGTDVFTRMARIWKVEEVGTVGTVEIEIPDTYDATHLIVSSSSALTSPTEVALTDNGDGTRSATLDFTDGQYFTFGVGASPGGVFTDIELWLRADVGVTEAAGDVTTWADQSGSGRDAAVTGVANLPSVSSIDIHYNPAIAFDNSNSESLESRSVFGNDTHSNINLFAVATVNSLANSFLFGEGSGSSDRVSAHIPWQSNLTIFWDAGANTGDNRLSTGWTESLATPYLWAFEYEASGPVQTIYKDGTSLVSDATVSTFTFAGTNAFQIGSYRGIEFIDADIAEMIAFNGALSDTEQQQIQTYLAIKYGITLGHNYLASDASTLWDVTANAPYQNDVIGIAREDESALNQKQAAAGIMTVALGALAADNASNANSFSSDAVFLIVGHDNGALTESAVTVGAYSADRLARVWFAEETGDTGATLALTFDLTGITVSGTVAADFQLVLDTDTDPSNGTRQIIAATSFASDVVTFSSVDIADNDYLILLTDYDLAPVGPPVTDGVAADGVLGQPDYDSSIKNNGGISASTLNNPGYFAMGPSGKVFVADTQNHRVLRWGSVNAAMDGSAAEAVLGQADFTSNSANRGSTVAANTMYTPSGIFVTSSGALFVADSENHRILRFDNAESASDGANADGVLGQADFISNEENRRQDVAANSLRWPKDLYMDSGGRLWAVDWLNHRVLRYDSATSKADGAGADGVLGQANFTTRILEWQNQTDINSLAYPAGVFVDNSGRLWVTDAGNSRILRFDTAASKANGADADGVLGQADFTSWRVNRGSTLAANTLHWPDAGIDGDNQGGIWVADRWNDRVLWYEDAAAKADGAAADAVLGQTDFTSSHGLVDNASFNSVHDVFIDTASDQVWIVDSAHNRVLRFDAAANSLGKTQESPELLIEEIPESFDLYQNYPNPFNPQTTIGYDIPEPVHVSIRVFDVLGRPVKVLVDEEMQAGKHEVHFEASGLAAGIYLYQMRAGTEVHVKKMILAK